MSDKPNSPSTQFTGPGSMSQQAVSAAQQGGGSELYMLVLKDVMERAEFGAKKYGHPLRTTAEVDFATNAYQEVLDLLIYFRAVIEQQKQTLPLLEAAWGLIANAGWDAASGNVDLAKTEGWHKAAIRWRDLYHEALPSLLRGECEEELDSRGPVG